MHRREFEVLPLLEAWRISGTVARRFINTTQCGRLASLVAEIEILGSKDVGDIANLLSSVFEHDPAYRFIFPTSLSRQRWLKKVFVATARIAIGYGQATGIRMNSQSELVAVALWYLPNRRFPPPLYRSLIPTLPILPMMLEYSTYCRFYQVYRFMISLLPRRERFLYLGGLAVSAGWRNKQLGTCLIRWGQAYAASARCRMILHCWSPLVRYYERLGFSPYSEGTLPGVGPAQHCLVWSHAALTVPISDSS